MRVLADTLAFQKSFATKLLKSLGIGQNLDREVYPLPPSSQLIINLGTPWDMGVYSENIQ